MPTHKLLILGGTGEAASLARGVVAAFGDRLHVISSLAGRTARPATIPGEIRMGGFGGVAGLERYLTDEGVHMLVDATHPFAATMSRHARLACDGTEVPRLTYVRPRWRKQAGDHWIEVESAAEAAQAAARIGGCALVTIGIKELDYFTGIKGCLVRLIEPPTQALPFDVVIGRGPFTVAAETRLLMDQRINVLVTKASGGAAMRAKITAARKLGLPVIMIRRPPAEPGARVRNINAALDWIAAHI